MGDAAGRLPPPPGVKPVFISMRSMDKYGLKTGPGIRDVVDYKLFPLEEIKADILKYGALSEFQPYKDDFNHYPLPEVLVIADKEEKYGQNFYVCVTEAAYNAEWQAIQAVVNAEENARLAAEAEEAARKAVEEAESKIIIFDTPLEARSYASATATASEQAVKHLHAPTNRPLLSLSIVRKRRDFGARIKFSDKDGGEQNAADFRQQRNAHFELHRRELDVGLQACVGFRSGFVSVSTQTSWQRPVNQSVQYEPRGMAVDAEAQVGGDQFRKFLQEAAPRCELALQQNETLNIFQDELALLNDDDLLVIGNKGENAIREARTFMDLEFSNNKSLVAIDWHPKIRQWLAAATAMNWSFEQRVDNSGISTKSHILVYNFSEFSSQIVLESPQEVSCFRWNPTNPSLLAAGCVTGQVMLFDLTAAQDMLNRKAKRKTESGETDKALRVKPIAISSIDGSHRRTVADLAWFPPTLEISQRGAAVTRNDTKSDVFVTISTDGQVLVWDIRFKQKAQARRKSIPTLNQPMSPGPNAAGEAAPETKEDKTPAEIPWLPSYRVMLMKGASELGLCSFAFNEEDPLAPIMFGTETGEVALADWAPVKHDGPSAGSLGMQILPTAAQGAAEGEGETAPSRVVWVNHVHHCRPVLAIQRSPFFPDLLMTIGDWSFSLWRTGMEKPLFTSPKADAGLRAARWSPTRPAVIFVAKMDGCVDIWDLVDQSHKPAMTTAVVSTPITSLEFRPNKLSTNKQLLAVGDSNGNLHVMEIPQQMRRRAANEEAAMLAYLKREQERVQYVGVRLEVRAAEAAAADAAAAAAAAEAERQAAAVGDPDEAAHKAAEAAKKQQEQEAKQYADLEARICGELGINADYRSMAATVRTKAATHATDGESNGITFELPKGAAAR